MSATSERGGGAGAAGEQLARAAVARYPVDPSSALTFFRHGENTTWSVNGPEGRFALRLARPGYQSLAAIRSELAWMCSLGEHGVGTPDVIAGRDGDDIQVVRDAKGTAHVAVTFSWVDGVALPEVEGLDAWTRLGALMARIHDHGGTWIRPPAFVRPAWDVEALVGERPRWGDACRPDAWAAEDLALVVAARDVVHKRLEAFGRAKDRFGLIHADLGFENVLVRPDGTTVVIDFDDSGPSWYLYELASVLYPLEGQPVFTQRRNALIAGYRSARALLDEHLAELPTLLMARRLATLGWTFTRPETAHARRQRPGRLASTPGAARRFLDWHAASPIGAAG